MNTDTPRQTSPFTGRHAAPGPVLAVKLDNHPDARPHTGIEHADIVYVERVEGGLSRILALYAATVPSTVGPVRSAREHQVEQLATFRRPALAYSGAQKGVEELIEHSPLWARSHDTFPAAYRREEAKKAPHNLFLTPAVLLKHVPDAGWSGDIGWRFGDKPDGGKPTATYEVQHPAATIGLTWSADESRWLASFDGDAAMNSAGDVQLGGATVVVQRVRMPPSRYQGADHTTPYMETVGQGDALILRDGEAFEARWSRPCPEAGTGFWLKDGGDRAPFARGQVWVLYDKAR